MTWVPVSPAITLSPWEHPQQICCQGEFGSHVAVPCRCFKEQLGMASKKKHGFALEGLEDGSQAECNPLS